LSDDGFKPSYKTVSPPKGTVKETVTLPALSKLKDKLYITLNLKS
jgi:hypothetical protein